MLGRCRVVANGFHRERDACGQSDLLEGLSLCEEVGLPRHCRANGATRGSHSQTKSACECHLVFCPICWVANDGESATGESRGRGRPARRWLSCALSRTRLGLPWFTDRHELRRIYKLFTIVVQPKTACTTPFGQSGDFQAVPLASLCWHSLLRDHESTKSLGPG
jgi:hypothetical protein